jgi:hypothetical protein
MMELHLLETGLFLGVLVLLGGCYGILYGVGRLLHRRDLRLAGFACYGLQCVATLAVVALSPLTGSWKLVVVVGTLGYLLIPPVTWRFVEWTHATEGHA